MKGQPRHNTLEVKEIQYLEPEFGLGDTIYLAHRVWTDRYEQCPDCCGKLYLTVILGDDSQVTIPCTTCSRGFDGPTGQVRVYEYAPSVSQGRVTRLEISETKIIYWCDCQRFDEDRSFRTREEAMQHAVVLTQEQEKDQAETLKKKKQPQHNWARDVTYYKREMKRAKEKFDRYAQKLQYAEVAKAKRKAQVS